MAGVPVVRVSDFTTDTIDHRDLKRIPTRIADEYHKYEVFHEDILVQTVGSWPSNPASVVGKCVRVPERCHKNLLNQNIVKLIPSDVIHKRFLFYLLRSSNFFDYIIHTAQGAASQAAITLDALRAFQFTLPPLETQQRIAAILGAYDDLMEVNRRRVAVLEEAMARGLFEEWFVRFRFPGHEDVPIVDTPDGPLPEGWEWKALGEVLSLRSGFAFKSATFVDEGPHSIVTIKHVHDGLLKPPFMSKIDALPDKMPAHCKIDQGDILVSLTGNVGRTCLAWGEDLLLNQRVAKVDPAEERYRSFAYCWFRSPNTLKRLQNIANGAAQQNLSPVQTVGLTLPIPSALVADHFEKIVHPILDSIRCQRTEALKYSNNKETSYSPPHLRPAAPSRLRHANWKTPHNGTDCTGARRVGGRRSAASDA